MKLTDILTQKVGANNNFPYIIAEAGVNHEGSMDTAKRLICEAADGGAEAIKFQSYKADTLASKNSPAYWDTSKEPISSQHELFKKHDSFWKDEFEKLKIICDQENIEFLSTPFDWESAKFLNDLMPVYKISSSDITNIPFISYLCGFNKPIILSTGASYIGEIQEAVKLMESKGNDYCLMHCVLNYPTQDKNANLGMIRDLIDKFPKSVIGYSDHTLPKDMQTCLLAYMLGANIIEKHFTHDKTLKGNDHYHAMDKGDLKLLCKKIDKANKLIGRAKKEPLLSEIPARKNARRSIVAKVDIIAGEVITEKHITYKRPASGISPSYYSQLLGKKAKFDIQEDEILQWDKFDL